MPIDSPLNASLKPSCCITDTRLEYSTDSPLDASRAIIGAFVIDSMPPAIKTSDRPASISDAAIMTAFNEEPHTLFRVVAGVFRGSPAPSAACLAGACPAPPCRTIPMYTPSTTPDSGGIFMDSSNPDIAIVPSCTAEYSERLPLYLPKGVRA